jgi:hypothetical protein
MRLSLQPTFDIEEAVGGDLFTSIALMESF